MQYQAVRHVLYIICLFFVAPVAAEGFLAGTLVKTPHGLQAIEQLTPGDLVYCCDASGNTATSRIAAIRVQKASVCTVVCAAGEEVAFLPSQKFYQSSSGVGIGDDYFVSDSFEGCWVQGAALEPSCALFSKLKQFVAVEGVESFELTDGAVLEFYALSLAEHHNYFVTRRELLVHNAFFVAIPIFTWVFGGGVTFAKLSAIAASVAVAIGMSKLDKELSKKGIDVSMSYCGQQPVEGSQQPEYNLQCHDISGRGGPKKEDKEESGNGERPPRTPKEKEEAFKKLVDSRVAERKQTGSTEPVRTWKDAGYHQINSSGSKSPPPHNGQAAVDKGLCFKDRSGRMSDDLVSREGSDFFVLRRTRTFERGSVKVEEYHGYKERWDDLTRGMKDALEEAGEVTSKGKVVTK